MKENVAKPKNRIRENVDAKFGSLLTVAALSLKQSCKGFESSQLNERVFSRFVLSSLWGRLMNAFQLPRTTRQGKEQEGKA